MSPKKKTSTKKTKKKPKKFLLELTFKSVIYWSGGLLFLLIWIFILGVLVGRGHLSFGLMKDKFAEVQEMVGQGESTVPETIKKTEENPKFAFYEELCSKKEEAAKKSRPAAVTKAKKKVPPRKITKKTDTRKATAKPVQQYVLQIGSFGDKSKATTLVNRLKKRDYPAYSLVASVDGKLYYRVKCGPFNTEKKADAFKKEIAQKEDIHGFVTRDTK
ncbi:MAG: SPOR domain-containing protein [Deltaproteobacteria bacterium]|nr:SPOR domain-containing protein [Deltaproteobacteria bacterium]